MQETTGFQFVKAIRHKNIPVIIYTGGKVTTQEKDSLLASGVIAILTKLNTTQIQIQKALNQVAIA